MSDNRFKSYKFLKIGKKNYKFCVNIFWMPFPNLKIRSSTYVRIEFPIILHIKKTQKTSRFS